MKPVNSSKLTIRTFDWAPDGPRAHVWDLRLRWACEEAELEYQLRMVPFEDRGAGASCLAAWG